jgi:hypothetical protein
MNPNGNFGVSECSTSQRDDIARNRFDTLQRKAQEMSTTNQGMRPFIGICTSSGENSNTLDSRKNPMSR